MNRKNLVSIGLALALVLAIIVPTLAQAPEPPGADPSAAAPAEAAPAEQTQAGGEPLAPISIEATLNSRINYQGVLKQNGSPVTGSRDMIFRLFSNSTCATQVGANITKNDVAVENGLFTVALDVTQSSFNGQGLWLQVEVGGTKIGCQEILAVPYALGLRAGTTMIVDSSSAALSVENGDPGGLWLMTKKAIAGWTSNGTAIFGAAASGGKAGEFYGTVQVNGDLKQNITSDGAVKAAALVVCSSGTSSVTRYFNNVNANTVTAASTGNAGECVVDFGFDVTERYINATVQGGGTGRGVLVDTVSGETVKLQRYNSTTGDGVNGSIYVVIY